MMLRFQWDSLRRGDHILAGDIDDAAAPPRLVVVELVDATGPQADVGLAAGWRSPEAAAA